MINEQTKKNILQPSQHFNTRTVIYGNMSTITYLQWHSKYELHAYEKKQCLHTPCSEKSGIFCFQRNFTTRGSIFLQFSVTTTE